MKRIFKVMTVVMCAVVIAGCGMSAGSVQRTTEQAAEEQATSEEVASINEEAEKLAKEQAEAEEKAKQEEEEKAKKEAEEKAKKEAEEKAKKEAEEKAREEEEKLHKGLDEKVDRTKINRFDKEQTMYMQRDANVRKGPAKGYDKVDYFKVNTPVTVVGRYEEKGWYLIKYKEDEFAFISNGLLGENEVDLDALKAAQEAAAMAAIQQAQAAAVQQAQAQPQPQPAPAQVQPAPAAPAPVAPVMAPAGILFIGDSRCVQMQEATGGGGCSWVCEGGKGYDWFTSKAMERAEPSIGKGTKVVICLGVNDPGNANRYAAFANQKAAEWAARGARTYFVSVNPVSDNPWTSPEQVTNFNNCVASQLAGIRWIDTNSVLTANGYCMVDGMHFDYNTNVTVFNLIVGSLR